MSKKLLFPLVTTPKFKDGDAEKAPEHQTKEMQMSATMFQCCRAYKKNIMERAWYCPGSGLPLGIFEVVRSE